MVLGFGRMDFASLRRIAGEVALIREAAARVVM
jgi:hypothetical protein